MVTKKTLLLEDMNTPEDAELISGVLHDVWGIRKVEIHLDQKEATISYNENAASVQDFEQAIADCGFQIRNAEGPIKQ
ncbi:heavy-metal-associated domain-containing protein [Caldalkalibacillus salinus]|uniref:heavy-metal-associated domain-containing protein n=1 Tax=Caldalkalibacillus salinus TaxID=2803787 RepID=UPI00192294BC|nr:heavy metal-associated domain-containing protein [Caldalkalibacillus salinus]